MAMISSRLGLSPVSSRSTARQLASRQGVGRGGGGVSAYLFRATARSEAFTRLGLGCERALNRSHLPEGIAKVPARERGQTLRIESVVRFFPLLQLCDLVLQSKGGEQLVHLFERARLRRLDRSVLAAHSQALDGCGQLRTGLETRVASEIDYREQPTMLDVERAPMPARMLDHDVSPKARRRLPRQRKPQHRPPKARAVLVLVEKILGVEASVRPVDHPPVEQDRG